MATYKGLIKRALRKLNAYNATTGEPSPSLLRDSLEELNGMINSAFANAWLRMAGHRENFTLTAGVSSYTIGDSMDFDTIRPYKILNAIIRESDIGHPLTILTEEQYRLFVVDKTTSGRPERIYYHPTYPTGTVQFHPVPSSTTSLYWTVQRPWTDITEENVTDDFVLEQSFEDAIVYNLAIRMKSEVGISLPPDIVEELRGLAESSKSSVMSLIAARNIAPCRLQMPGIYRRYTNLDNLT